MTLLDPPDPALTNCRWPPEVSDGRRYMSSNIAAALIAVGVTLFLAAGGWVGSLITGSANANAMEKRIATIERRDEQRDVLMGDLLGRVSHMEGMLVTLVERTVQDRK